jgi:hypothetical protein
MKHKSISKSVLGLFIFAIAFIVTVQGNVKAQTNAGQDTPVEEPLQPASQQLDYRTPQQIFQRRVNNATITCDASNSAECSQVTPELESIEENETLRQIRDARQEQSEGSNQ